MLIVMANGMVMTECEPGKIQLRHELFLEESRRRISSPSSSRSTG